MAQLEVQMRDIDGALTYLGTIAECMEKAKHDSNIWKISWTDATTGERIRLVRRTIETEEGHERDVWAYEPLDIPALSSSERR